MGCVIDWVDAFVNWVWGRVPAPDVCLLLKVSEEVWSMADTCMCLFRQRICQPVQTQQCLTPIILFTIHSQLLLFAVAWHSVCCKLDRWSRHRSKANESIQVRDAVTVTALLMSTHHSHYHRHYLDRSDRPRATIYALLSALLEGVLLCGSSVCVIHAQCVNIASSIHVFVDSYPYLYAYLCALR